MSQHPAEQPPLPPGSEDWVQQRQPDPGLDGGQQQSPPPALPSFLRNIPPQAWTRMVLILLVFFGGALFMAAITAAFSVSSLGSPDMLGSQPEFDAAFSGGPSWIVLTFQLLSMGFLSPLSIGFDIGTLETFSEGGSLFFVPWLVPAGGIAAVAATQRFLGGNLRASRTGARLLLASLSGLVFAIVLTILAVAIQLRFDGGGSDGFGGRIWAHAGSVPGFIVSGLLLGFITYLLFLPKRGVLLHRVLGGIATVFEHVVGLAVLCAVGVLIWALVRGETSMVLAVLAAFPTVGFFGFSMLHFVPTVVSGNDVMRGEATEDALTMFFLPAGGWIIAILVMLVAVFVVSVRWSLRTRFQAHTVWAWMALPITYVGVGVLLTAANGLYLSLYVAGENFQASFHSASWGFLVWLLLGGIVQVLASYLIPGLTYYLPTGLLRVLGLGLVLPPGVTAGQHHPGNEVSHTAPSTTSATESLEQTVSSTTVAGSLAAQADGPVPDPQAAGPVLDPQGGWATDDGWGPAGPVGQESGGLSKKTKTVIFSSLGVVGLIAIVWVAHTVLARTVFGPQDTAEAYLQAVVDGRAEDALDAMGPNVTDAQRGFATDEVYQTATDRPDTFELGEVHRDGSSVTVEATLSQSGKTYPLELTLSASGTQAMVFNDWKLDGGDVAGRALYMSGPSQLTVNDVETTVAPAGQQFAEDSDEFLNFGEDEFFDNDSEVIKEMAQESGQVLLPGTYTFTAPEGSKYLSHGEDLELTITPEEISTKPIQFSQHYTAAFEEDVTQQIEQRLESCLADRTIRIEDCEAASWEDTTWNAMTDMKRTWEQTPEVVLVPTGTDSYSDDDSDLAEYSGPVTARIVEGSINLTYQVRDEKDDDWSDRERVYSPFEAGASSPMELPVTLDGDDLTIDYSPLDEPNPQWLSPEYR